MAKKKAKAKKAKAEGKAQKRTRPKTRTNSGTKKGRPRAKQESNRDAPARKKSTSKSKADVDPLEKIRPYMWKPGQSGNPTGRPKGSISLSARLKRILQLPVKVNGSVLSADYLVADNLIDIAITAAQQGRFPFFKEIIDRVDGKVPDHVVLENTKRLVATEAATIAREILTMAEDLARSYFDEAKVDGYVSTLEDQIANKFAGDLEAMKAEGEDDSVDE